MDNSSLIGTNNEFPKIIAEHCYIPVYYFDIDNFLYVTKYWTNSDYILLLYNISYEWVANLHKRYHAHFVMLENRQDENYKNYNKTKNNTFICDATNRQRCTDTKSINNIKSFTIILRKFEPYTVINNKSIFSCGTEILLMVSIARKLNVEISFENEKLSKQR